ncbi:hypothetical protein [Aphanothece sacrum]|uniref:Uncharacterized protein n=1 Tax=Aphanothece sacrum FPU1 TaxID=1920663 RepID=A0A401IHN3_APHSA|nr:hypothetical protein [Aphanothece sacrum]GBF80710.1 hypothetical protein AsFPU1_2114 [Aphanothece sacrum FPU1]GBF83204.1 hypothetical protein AsFPU3_0243 [Aphanothece sacrum FPU3]
MNYLSRILFGTSIVAGTLLAMSTEVRSLNLYNTYDEEALTQIADNQILAKVEGFTPDTYQILRESPRRQVAKATMNDFVVPGQYAIFAGCDDQCSGINITVTDASGKKLVSDKGKQSAHVLVTQAMSSEQPLKIEMEVKCNTSGAISGVESNDRKVEACYSYSTIWQKVK